MNADLAYEYTGHDDAIAILLAVQLPQINLLGISTVHGNGTLRHTTRMLINSPVYKRLGVD